MEDCLNYNFGIADSVICCVHGPVAESLQNERMVPAPAVLFAIADTYVFTRPKPNSPYFPPNKTVFGKQDDAVFAAIRVQK